MIELAFDLDESGRGARTHAHRLWVLNVHVAFIDGNKHLNHPRKCTTHTQNYTHKTLI